MCFLDVNKVNVKQCNYPVKGWRCCWQPITKAHVSHNKTIGLIKPEWPIYIVHKFEWLLYTM